MSEEEREQEAVLAFLKGYRERRRAELQKIQPKEGFLHPNWIITERNAARWSQIVTS